MEYIIKDLNSQLNKYSEKLILGVDGREFIQDQIDLIQAEIQKYKDKFPDHFN